MKTLTVRMPDEDYDELDSIAQSRGTTISALARDQLGKLRKRQEDEHGRPRTAEAPESMTALDRHMLSLMHRILARVIPEGENTEDGDYEHQLMRARVLERGWIAEYPDEFLAINAELSRRETRFVMDVLDMFTQLERSYDALTDADRAELGDDAGHAVRFQGFDFNDRLEGRLADYAQHLIDQGRWTWMARYFDPAHDGGNSHWPMYQTYARMLEEFRPIWALRREDITTIRDEQFRLKPSEIRHVLDARVHPSNRR